MGERRPERREMGSSWRERMSERREPERRERMPERRERIPPERRQRMPQRRSPERRDERLPEPRRGGGGFGAVQLDGATVRILDRAGRAKTAAKQQLAELARQHRDAEWKIRQLGREHPGGDGGGDGDGGGRRKRERDDAPDAPAEPAAGGGDDAPCLLYTSPSPRDGLLSRMPSSA